MYLERINHKMDQLLRGANIPVLTDIEVGLRGEIEVYPFPIPDLFIDRPVMVACLYSSESSPSKIVVRGFNPHGDQESYTSKVVTRNDLPVEKIFIKEQIDIMTADAWLGKSKKLEQKVVVVPGKTNMPSLYNSTLMFETTETHLREEDDQYGDGKGGFISKIFRTNRRKKKY